MFFSKDLKKIKNINHCFFSRKNGLSTGIYSGLNCGKGSKDNKQNVLKNLEIVSYKMNTKLNKLILMNQTHSNKVIVVSKDNIKNKIFNSDALITNIKGIVLGVLTADCVPIILYDKRYKTIGCIHAGWKGAYNGIIENTISQFKKLGKKNNIYASIGPCIGQGSYEVGEEFYEKFIDEIIDNHQFFKKTVNNKFLFNIKGYVTHKLESNGVKNIDIIERDTFKDVNNFYSYRRSQKLKEADYGRCISTICLKT